MTRTINVYGASLANVKRDAASVIAEQAAEGWHFTRITVRRSGEFDRLYTHVAEITFEEAKTNVHR